MSLDIDWSLLSGPSKPTSSKTTSEFQPPIVSEAGPPSDDLATHLITALNAHLSSASTSRPSFLGPIRIETLDFGSNGPEVEIRDVRDVWRAFDDVDPQEEQEEEDEEESGYGYDYEHLHGNGDEPWSPVRHTGIDDYFEDEMEMDLGMEEEMENESVFSGMSPRKMGIGDVGMGFGLRRHDLALPSLGQASSQTNHRSRAASWSEGPIHGISPNSHTQRPHHTSRQVSRYPHFHGLANQDGAKYRYHDPNILSPHRDQHRFGSAPHRRSSHATHQTHTHTHTHSHTHPPPSPPARPRDLGLPAATGASFPSSPPSSSSSIPSLQLHLHVSYASDASITLHTSLQVNYPSASFMALPLKVVVTGLKLEADIVMAYTPVPARRGKSRGTSTERGHRVHLSIVDEPPRDDAGNGGLGSGEGGGGRYDHGPYDDHDTSNGHGYGYGHTHAQGRGHGHAYDHPTSASGRAGIGQRILPELHIESEIGHSDAHVLRNVGKIERFIADAVRKTLVDELVFPNFHTIGM